MTPLCTLTYHGRPQVKKNRQIPIMAAGRPRIIPPKLYTQALRSALTELSTQSWPDGMASKSLPVHIKALFYMGERQKSDLDGLITACADILESAGVLVNDYWIESWDRSRRLKSNDNPRTEVTIWPMNDGGRDE